MSLPPPVTKQKYSKITQTTHKASKTVAESCMSDAAREIKIVSAANDTAIFDTSVSNDCA